MGFIRIVNPKTGQVVMEEYDDGTLRVVSEQMLQAMTEAAKDGRVPTGDELEEMVRQIEREKGDAWTDEEEEEGEEEVGEGVVPYAGGPIINSDTWDASAAKKRIAKWASSDGSGSKEKINWSKYAKAFLFVEEPRDNFGSYSYPHHDVKDGQLGVHRKGVISAMAFLLKVRPAGTEAGYNHLSKHYKAMDMEPPPLKKEAYTNEEMAAYFGEGWQDLVASAL